MQWRTTREVAHAAELLAALRRVDFPPEVLRQVGLPKDWQKRVPPRIAKQIARYLERYKETFDELAKR